MEKIPSLPDIFHHIDFDFNCLLGNSLVRRYNWGDDDCNLGGEYNCEDA